MPSARLNENTVSHNHSESTDSFDQQWHLLPEAAILEIFDTTLDKGLDPEQVEQRQKRFGLNRITQKNGRGSIILFLLQFHQPLVYILLAAAAVASLLREWVDAGVIFGVVLVNAIIGFMQEAKAVKAIESLVHAMSSTATVIRGTERRQIPAAELVPGDIVLLQSGDKVPADLRLLNSRELQIDESTLTGESVPVQKQSESLPGGTLLAERSNMAYSSTLVTYGIATGVVIATGNCTEIGRINALIAAADILATPLTKKVARFSGMLLYVIFSLAALTFLVGILRGNSWLDMFMAVVALAVGAIPEGLPAAVTITLAIGVGKMAKRNAIIRKLPAVETLGSTTVICSDKTGTLTRNQMTVQQIYAGGDLFLVSGTGYTPEGTFTHEALTIASQESPALRECLLSGLLCNDAVLINTNDAWQAEGDPTEAALVVAALKGGFERVSYVTQRPRLDTIPFESRYQYMATLHDNSGGRIVYMKGAVESILARCSKAVSRRGELIPVVPEVCYRVAAQMAEKGLRVLAFARIEMNNSAAVLVHDDIAAGLTFLGLQGMIDPPRPAAIAAVRICLDAGIQVKMITGDHAITATAIAGQIGLIPETYGSGQALTLNGREIEALSDAELTEAAMRCVVFARVAPEQKLRLVKALQASGNIVAMTGDGVNDAPALRQADIGVVMGIAGTEVAKEAADMLLTDDDFSSIQAAVEEGRGVYDNLVKFITWTLPTNIGEGLVILAAVFAGVQLPITPVQILWINMTTAVLLGLMLAFEPKEPGIMKRTPLDSGQPILTVALVMRIGLVGILLLVSTFGLFEWELKHGSSVAAARTCAVNVFVFGELFYLFNCRSLRYSMFRLGLFSNNWVLGGVTLMVLLQILFTYSPAMHAAFGSQSIGLREWLLIISASLVVYVVIEFEKWIGRVMTGKADDSSNDQKLPGTTQK